MTTQNDRINSALETFDRLKAEINLGSDEQVQFETFCSLLDAMKNFGLMGIEVYNSNRNEILQEISNNPSISLQMIIEKYNKDTLLRYTEFKPWISPDKTF